MTSFTEILTCLKQGLFRENQSFLAFILPTSERAGGTLPADWPRLPHWFPVEATSSQGRNVSGPNLAPATAFQNENNLPCEITAGVAGEKMKESDQYPFLCMQMQKPKGRE